MSNVKLRYMRLKDADKVLDIEHDSFADPWPDQEFRNILSHRNCIGMVAEQDGQVVGFVVYALMPRHIQILNLAVRHSHRRQGIGRSFIDRLKGRVRGGNRLCLLLEVADWNLRAQVFFRACGLRCGTILRSHFADVSDAFQFGWYARVRATS
jgi:ribosomal-protein-alanine N-acetyltransferase